MSKDSPLDSAPKDATDENFTITVDAGEDQVPVSKGSYPAMVGGVRASFSNAGNPMLVWDFVLLDKKNAGKSLTMYTAQTPAAMWKLTATLTGLGFTKDKDGKIKFKPDEAKHRRCIIDVVEESFEGQPRSAIKSVHKHPDGYAWPEGQTPPKFDGKTPF